MQILKLRNPDFEMSSISINKLLEALKQNFVVVVSPPLIFFSHPFWNVFQAFYDLVNRILSPWMGVDKD